MNLVRMWIDTVEELTASCEYDSNSHEYLVTVRQGDKSRAKRFTATYEPRFGMDVADLAVSQGVAEELAVALEKGE